MHTMSRIDNELFEGTSLKTFDDQLRLGLRIVDFRLAYASQP